MIEKAVKLCRFIEKRLRPIGWHCALTGSCLYGMGKTGEPGDIDIILYQNNDDRSHDESADELFDHLGIKEVKYVEVDDYARDVYRVWMKDKTKVDFFILT